MHNEITNSEIVADIKHVLAKLGTKLISRTQYLQHGKYSVYHIYDGGRTWSDLCKNAGIRTMAKENVSDDVYFDRLKTAYQKLGRLPKTSERKLYGLNFSKRRYATLNEFIIRASELGFISKELVANILPRQELPLTYEKPPIPTSTTSQRVPPIPIHSKRTKWQRINVECFPYAPQDELGVVCLFGILCSKKLIDWQILELRGGKGIDTTCYDNTYEKEITVELKYTLSRSSWNHPIEELDFVVCWKNRWPDFPKPVIELSSLITKTLN